MIDVLDLPFMYLTREHDSSKTNEPILMLIGTSGPLGKGTKQSTLGSGGQGQGHTMPKIDFESWRRLHSTRPFWVEYSSSFHNLA